MKELSKHLSKCLIPCKNQAEYIKNIRALKRQNYIEQLYKCAQCKDFRKLLKTKETIPRILESYLIIDFEKKRTLICEFLISIHIQHAKVFTLEKYLIATKTLFTIITQYYWSREDITFTLKAINIYLQIYFSTLSEESIHAVFRTFAIYGPWSSSEIESIYSDSMLIDISKNSFSEVLENMKNKEKI